MIQLLAGAFFIFFPGVFAQHSPLDTTAPITRIAPPLRNGATVPDNFGFAVALYQLDPAGTNISLWRVVVGAPNGTYPGGLSINNPSCSSRLINNTGLVYLCSIQPGKELCDGAVGNGTAGNGRLFDCQAPPFSPSVQQTGASLYSSGGYLAACAPGFSLGDYAQPVHKGVCYVSFNNSLRTFNPVYPCRDAYDAGSAPFNDDFYCYSGLSLALKNKIAIFGSPLAFTTGMASYTQLDILPTGFSSVVSKASTGGVVYGSTSMNVNGSITYKTNTLKGYSVGIGRITRSNISDYLVAIPRWNISTYVGSVEVFAFPNNGEPILGSSPPLGGTRVVNVGVYDSLMNVTAYGTQTGEQFGASMDTADLDQDGYDELIVGAPFYTDYSTTTFSYEVGRVYVFQNTKGNLSTTPIILSSTTPSIGGRFGHVVVSVGDINDDGTEDFAVGAPYEPCTSSDNTSSTGSVYLYAGGRTTLVTLVQKITACDVRQMSLTALNNATIRSFGYSLASKGDLDGNSYNDLAIGAYESRAVFVLRAFSVAVVAATLANVGGSVPVTVPDCNSPYACGTVMLCATFNCSSRPNSCSSNLKLTFDITESKGRAFFNATSVDMRTISSVVTAIIGTSVCTNVTFYSMLNPADLSALVFTATVQGLSRTLVSDNGAALADFKAIPVLRGGSASVNVAFARTCANPACMSNLSLHQPVVMFRDALQIVQNNLTVNATASIVLTLSVSNTGDEVSGINLMMSAPSYVTGMQITTLSRKVIPCTKTNATGFVCSSIVDGYLTRGNTSVLEVALTVDTTSISYDPSTLVFNVSSGETEDFTMDNIVNVVLKPTASADLSIISGSFIPSGTTYSTPKTTANPTNLGSIGLLTTLTIDFQRSGLTYIPSLTLTLALPLGGSEWDKSYLYPASVTTSVPTLGVSCTSGFLNPNNLQTTKKRSLTSDMIKDPPRTARQTQRASLILDCSQSSSTDCRNLICNITNLTAVTTAFSVKVLLYVNDRYFSVNGGSGNTSLTATVTASIPTPASFAGVVSNPSVKAALSIIAVSKPQPQPLNLGLIIGPVVAVVVIIVIAVIALYACGFFKRKKRENEDAVEGVEGTVATVAVTKKDAMDESMEDKQKM